MPSTLLNLKAGMVTDADMVREIAVYADSGAVTQTKSATLILTKAQAQAMTIAAPLTAMNGVTLTFLSMSAVAHTVTFATIGFNAGGEGADVATFGAAKGNGFTIIAYNGVWYVLNLTGVTLG